MVERTVFAPLLRERTLSHLIRNRRNGRVLATRVVGAFDGRSRRVGLLRHVAFDPGEALLIVPTSAIHTCFMRFPIDVAFLTRAGRILKASTAVPPWRVAIALRAYAALELPAGTLTRCDTFAGDELVVESGASSDPGETKLRTSV